MFYLFNFKADILKHELIEEIKTCETTITENLN
jgi:hypothetical protein